MNENLNEQVHSIRSSGRPDDANSVSSFIGVGGTGVKGPWETCARGTGFVWKGGDNQMKKLTTLMAAAALLAFVSIMLTAIDAGTATAHHREGHTRGNNGGGGGGNDGRVSFNAGVLMGQMTLFKPV